MGQPPSLGRSKATLSVFDISFLVKGFVGYFQTRLTDVSMFFSMICSGYEVIGLSIVTERNQRL